MISWKSIEQQIKKHLSNMNIEDVKVRNLNTNFEQTTDLKTFYEDYYPEMEMDIMTAQIQQEQEEISNRNKYETKPTIEINESQNNHELRSNLEFSPNQISKIPSHLTNILPNSDELCIYGVPRNDSFLMSVTLIVKKDFLFYDKRKEDFVKDKKMELALCLKDYFKEYNYIFLGAKRADMEEELINSSELNDYNRWYIANYYKVNIIIINLVNKTYQLVSSWNTDYPVILILNENDIYLPVLCAQGENIFPIDMLKTIMQHLEEQKNPLVVSYDKKMASKLKQQQKKKEQFKDLSNMNEKQEKQEKQVSESDESDTESEPEIISDDSDIEIKVNYQINNDDENNDENDDENDEKNVKKSSKKVNKSFSSKSKLNKSKSEIKKMILTDLKVVAKDMGIAMSQNSKAKKKSELLDEILENM
jgi:hypothetical protein